MSTDENDDIVKELNEIKDFLKKKNYIVDSSNTEDTDHELVVNCEKKFDYNDDDGEYKNLGTIKIKIVFDDNESSGGFGRKRIIKRKKSTRKKRKTRK
jgi:hypothetical protein